MGCLLLPPVKVGHMPIRNYLEHHAAFEPDAMMAISQALEEVCLKLQIRADQKRDREVVAIRLIDLARNGVIDTKALCERVLLEAGSPPSLAASSCASAVRLDQAVTPIGGAGLGTDK